MKDTRFFFYLIKMGCIFSCFGDETDEKKPSVISSIRKPPSNGISSEDDDSLYVDPDIYSEFKQSEQTRTIMDKQRGVTVKRKLTKSVKNELLNAYFN